MYNTFGQYNRVKSVHTPQYFNNIQEEPDVSVPNIRLPALPTEQRPKSGKDSFIDSSDVLHLKTTQSKVDETPTEESKNAFHDLKHK